jgi:hypothetical protein
MVKDAKRDETLRNMVREVLQDVLGGRSRRSAGAEVTNEPVRIETDSELQTFVRRVTDPSTAEAVRSGRIAFTLVRPNGPPRSEGFLDGVITEQKVDGLARSGTLVLGPGAVLTPLAKDRARRLGLKIERRR